LDLLFYFFPQIVLKLQFELAVGWMKIAVCWIEKIRELFSGNRDTRDLNPRN